MRTLYRYLKPYWRIVLLALVLAAINQIFSLLDPLIFRHVIDSYATQYDKYTRIEFFRGVGLLLLQCSPQLEEMERFAEEVMPLVPPA